MKVNTCDRVYDSLDRLGLFDCRCELNGSVTAVMIRCGARQGQEEVLAGILVHEIVTIDDTHLDLLVKHRLDEAIRNASPAFRFRRAVNNALCSRST